MTKKNLLFLIFIFLSIKLFAQTTDLKYYSDYSKNFSGYAVAVYYGNISEIDKTATEEEILNYIIEKCSGKLTRINKLTKKNNWLYKEAMNEWECSKGELYGVLCVDTLYAKEGIFLFVIVRGQNDFIWAAYEINTEMKVDEIFSEE